MSILRIATCQFPTSSDVDANAKHVAALMREAQARGADVAHFPEAALAGYAGADLPSYDGYDWSRLRERTLELFDLAGRLGLWLVLGSAHPLTPPHKPHLSLYVVDDRGRLVDRYDKRFCAGDPDGDLEELAHYTPGDHASVFEIGGVRCGTLICHEYRYPELYRDYVRQGVQLVFHSYHAAHVGPERQAAMRAAIEPRYRETAGGDTYPGITMPPSMIAAAAANHVAISCPNSSARECCWGSFFVRPDGVVTGRLERHETGLLLSTFDPAAALYDSTRAWRGRAMDGTLHSGTLVRDERSSRRTEL